MNVRDASLVFSFDGLGLFMLGHLVGSRIMRRVCVEKILLFCTTGTVVTTPVVLLNVGATSSIALLCGYTSEAIMLLTIFAPSLRGLGNHTKRVSSLLMTPPAGGVTGPLLMGAMANCITMVITFIVPLAAYLVVRCYARKILSVVEKIQ